MRSREFAYFNKALKHNGTWGVQEFHKGSIYFGTFLKNYFQGVHIFEAFIEELVPGGPF